MIYLDTSVMVPFYWTEVLTNAIAALLRSEPEPALSQLVEVELISALSRRVRMAEIPREEATAIANRFQTDCQRSFYISLPIEPVHYTMARTWINRFDSPLRTLDALHLAVASAHNIPLVTADIGLAESANSLGIAVQILAP